MNHGLKINGNILEITLPEEVHIDRVMVNRQMFSQRQKVCESCKYHDLEGHEEPCVSCEVGNSNYVPSVGLEERTEERTETHACDCISRQVAIDTIRNIKAIIGTFDDEILLIDKAEAQTELMMLPSAEPQIIHCKDCKWWDRYNEKMGYCHAAKHGYMSTHWDISIRRTYEEDFYCADAERGNPYEKK